VVGKKKRGEYEIWRRGLRPRDYAPTVWERIELTKDDEIERERNAWQVEAARRIATNG
jgi:hypothetical protein